VAVARIPLPEGLAVGEGLGLHPAVVAVVQPLRAVGPLAAAGVLDRDGLAPADQGIVAVVLAALAEAVEGSISSAHPCC
jgi:hypothetical protein